MINKNKFITKDSGKRQIYESGMKRDVDIDKPSLYYWIPQDIPYEEQVWTRLGKLATRGANKYGCRNMDKADSVEELERFKNSAFRHMLQWLCNETDEDHMAGTVFNILQAENVRWRIKNKKEGVKNHT